MFNLSQCRSLLYKLTVFTSRQSFYQLSQSVVFFFFLNTWYTFVHKRPILCKVVQRPPRPEGVLFPEQEAGPQ
ncbi:unnamed protein product [Ixodes pacificus]